MFIHETAISPSHSQRPIRNLHNRKKTEQDKYAAVCEKLEFHQSAASIPPINK